MVAEGEGCWIIWGGGWPLVDDTMMNVEGAPPAVLQVVLKRDCH